MSYTTGMPTSGQSLGQTQQLVQNNFNKISNFVSTDHIGFDLTNEGKHKYVRLPKQTSSIPTTAANEIMLYNGDVFGNSSLFLRQQNGTQDIFLAYGDMDAADLARFSNNTNYTGTQSGGWTFMGGGLLLQYGLKTSAGSSGSVTFPKAFAGTPFCIQVSLKRNSGNQSVSVDSSQSTPTTTFNYLSSSSGSDLYWIAIGF